MSAGFRVRRLFLLMNSFPPPSVDKIQNQVELSLRKNAEVKAAAVDLSELKKGQVVKGIIQRVETYGAFIRIEGAGCNGLCHKSKVTDDEGTAWTEFVKQGKEVKAVVLDVNAETRKISLGLKKSLFPAGQVDDDNDDDESAEEASEDEVMQGDDDDEDEDEDDEVDIADLDFDDGESDEDAEMEDEVSFAAGATLASDTDVSRHPADASRFHQQAASCTETRQGCPSRCSEWVQLARRGRGGHAHCCPRRRRLGLGRGRRGRRQHS